MSLSQQPRDSLIGSPARSPALPSDPAATTDLCLLVGKGGAPGPSTAPTPDAILNTLKARFLSDIPYTWLSPRAIIAVAPNKEVPLNSDHSLSAYASDWRDSTEDRRQRIEKDGARQLGTAPHVWQLAGKAYYYMRRTGGDGSILLSGDTGSGKSEARKLAIRHLVDLAVPLPGKKGSKLVQQIPAAQFILETFGNATRTFNPNASCFGQYIELQFSESGRLCGLKTLDYYLERSRVIQRPVGERNFHIFSYLAAGGSPEERAYLHLDEVPSATGGGLTGMLPTSTSSSGPQAFRYITELRNMPPGSRASDARAFAQLKQAFKAVGFTKRVVASICQLLAAILHLGNIEFIQDNSKNAEAASIANPATLEVVASFLGVHTMALEIGFTYQTRMVGGEKCTVFLDPEGASMNRDKLAKTLYGLLFSWLNEHINQKLCRDDFATFISIIDLPGLQNAVGREGNGLDAFCVNLASERTQAFIFNELFVKSKVEFVTEELTNSLPGLEIPYFDNSEMVRVLTAQPGGLVHIVDDQSRRKGKTDATMLDAMGRRWGNHASFGWKAADERIGEAGTFSCSHWTGNVTYSTQDFLEDNRDAIAADFVDIFAGQKDAGLAGSKNSLVRQLFSSSTLATTTNRQSDATIVTAQQAQRPVRSPSTRKKGGREEGEKEIEKEDDKASKKDLNAKSVVEDFNSSITTLLETLADTKSWFIFCIRPNEQVSPNLFDSKLVKHQIRALNLAELTKRLAGEWLVSLDPKGWWERYSTAGKIAEESAGLAHLTWIDKIPQTRALMGWTEADLILGKFKVFIGDAAFRQMEDTLRAKDTEEQRRYSEKAAIQGQNFPDPSNPFADANDPRSTAFYDMRYAASEAGLPLVDHGAGPGYYDDDRKTLMTDHDGVGTPLGYAESRSNIGTERYAPSVNMFEGKRDEEKDLLVSGGGGTVAQSTHHEEVAEEIGESSQRKKWVFLVWFLTWPIPGFLLGLLGRMKRPDIRMAWREKLAINILIWLICGCSIFIIAIMGDLICPKEHVFSNAELQSHSYSASVNNMLVAIRGEVFDLTSFAPLHYPSVVPTTNVRKYGGTDISALFPIQVSALCSGDGSGVSQYVTLASTNSSETNAQYHDFRISTNDYRPDWYYERMIMLRYNYRKGFMGTLPSTVKSNARDKKKVTAILDGGVYDLTDYVNIGPGIQAPLGSSAPGNVDTQFMDANILQLFQTGAGTDITKRFNALNIDPGLKQAQKICLRNLFFQGKVDNRQSPQCKFSDYILLSFSLVMVSIIGFKFLAALQFSKAKQPEEHEKFVLIQIPCYTEGEDSLKTAIDSVTQLKYDDKRKLIVIVCDGMIIGSGNDRPTPRIVLDILGADAHVEAEALSFLSLGEGAKQHNMGKVYSGLYESGGHVVPYLVVAKCGKPSERSRPGNRGKRDSQMLLMRFLNRVHFDSPMSPLELEMYHQIKNVIGVNPSFYEYCLMIDADTTVEKFALNRMISAMIYDQRIIGLCGETSLANAKQSMVTAMQVYEYFISHHLAKAFESLFGSVTCLPGCFTLYRLRTSEHKPLLVSNQIIQAYSVNRVDTLHMKNLLHLGEDRYLTTVLLKTFPSFKTKFIPKAYAQTIAPDEWKVLLSQRRRWINSTIHNLAELLMIERLCGFCCFSMRFIVFIDLLSTLIQPVTVAYIVYLVYRVVNDGQTIPLTSLVMIAAIYGLQMLIFIFHRKFEHIGWMIVYILAIPIQSFVIPVYAFWRMDDFSWGNTRVVMGELGKKLVIHDEGKFDPTSIPLKTWQEYENELWERGSNQSIGSIIAHKQREAMSNRDGSVYGQESAYDPPMAGGGLFPISRTHSPGMFDPYAAGPHGQASDARSMMSGYAGTLLGARGAVPIAGNGSILGVGVGPVGGGGNPYMGGSHQPGASYGGGATSPGGFYNAVDPHSAMSVHSIGGGYMPASGMPVTMGAGYPGYAGSQVGGMMAPTGGFGSGSFMDPSAMMKSASLPSAEQLAVDIGNVLAKSDLNTTSMKSVRKQLEIMYGLELTGENKTMVNRMIEDQINSA